jgi:hypothetical protein
MKFFNNTYLGAWDLEDDDGNKREAKVTIKSVAVELVTNRGDKEQLPVMYFEGKTKGLILTRTNAKRLVKLLGANADAWPGKRVTLHQEFDKAAFGGMWIVRVKEK